MSNIRVEVIGPAYLDRVLRVDGPLVNEPPGPPVDQSTDGAWEFASTRGIEVIDPTGYTLAIAVPDDWPGPTGQVRLTSLIREGAAGRRSLRGLEWHDDLGGMGAGYAAALNGTLVCALGAENDPTSREVSKRLRRRRIAHKAILVPDHGADWTLLITSGELGDKLPIGFRGCHAAIDAAVLSVIAEGTSDLRVVASLPNALSACALRKPGAGVKLFAPAMRNMLDREFPVGRFAAAIDVLCCNRIEWEALEDREDVRWQVSILVVTDGPRGSTVRYTTPQGDPGLLQIKAFPRERPPRDTNRAGEAYGATFIGSLLEQEWDAGKGVVEDELIRVAAERASAAAALVLDRVKFGFPSAREIDKALKAGRV
jgi:hypothetical protein